MKVLVGIILLLALPVFGWTSELVETKKVGFYTQILEVKSRGPYTLAMRYLVDTISQQCFAALTYDPRGITKIQCEDLAKRPEWKPIITWVEAK